jgi:hypothetical protein
MSFILTMSLFLSSNNVSHYFFLENSNTSEKILISISEVEPVSRLPFCRGKLSAVYGDANADSRAEMGVVFVREPEQACIMAVKKRDYFLVTGCLDVARTLELSWNAYKFNGKTQEFPFDLINSIRCDNFNRDIIIKSKYGPTLLVRVDRGFENVLNSAIVNAISDPVFSWKRKEITRAQALDFLDENFNLQSESDLENQINPFQ